MLYVKEARGTVAEVTERVQTATKARGFGVLAVLDLKAKMVEKGVDFGPECRILEVCNPKQAKAVLTADMSVSTALPCRISVYEESGKVKVATLKPTAVLELFGQAKLKPVAQEVEKVILAIIDDATA